MNKYNEIMSNVTVDPEMKSRIMSAVSQAIKDQSAAPDDTDGDKANVTDLTNKFVDTREDREEKTVRKKARVIPIAVISSIAAALLVLIGVVWFFSRYLGAAKSASSTIAAHNSKVEDVSMEIDSVIGGGNNYAENTAANDEAPEVAAETTTAGGNQNISLGGDRNYSISNVDKTKNITGTKLPGENEEVDYSEGIGNDRIDGISRKLPFELKGTGSGTYTDGSLKEVFMGENDEKVIVVTTYESTDVLKKVFPSNKSVSVAGTTPGGIAVELYYVPFGNVPKLEKGETTTNVNAAVFMKNGYKYLIVYSDVYAPEVIYDLVDVI